MLWAIRFAFTRQNVSLEMKQLPLGAAFGAETDLSDTRQESE